jgi:16S rRNA (cytosine1402-N4)-methyltransferase
MPEEKAENLHRSVLLNETLEILDVGSGELFVDATLGLGGHTEAILTASQKGRVIGLDQDKEAIDLARQRLSSFGDRVEIHHSNFSAIKTVLASTGIDGVDGILADLGVSSLQLDSETRGFSFRFDAPLDMRMNAASSDITAAELLATLSETEIANIIFKYGEERFSRRVARRIVERRKQGRPVTTTGELVELVERSVPRSSRDKIHPATRTFQALRIAVNRETEALERFVIDAVDVLKIGGRLAIITFHSLEDRIVKQAFQKMSGKCFCPPKIPKCVCGAKKEVEILTRKPIVPVDKETTANPRSRSAKLRAVRKIEASSRSVFTE